MPPNTSWSNQFNKSEMKLNLKGIGWKTLMSECLMKTDILNQSSEKCLDPNETMNERHKMARNSVRIFPTPREQIQTEAMKLLREETHNRLRKQKQGKIVEKEIERLKRILENHRQLSQKQLEEVAIERVKHGKTHPPKFSEKHLRLWRRFESYRVNPLVNDGCHVKNTREPEEEISRPVSCNRKGSIADGKDEGVCEVWGESEGKSEIMKRFLQTPDVLEVTSEKANRSCLEKAWKTWRNFTIHKKKRTAELNMYACKIEEFLTKLREGGKPKIKQRNRSYSHSIKCNKVVLKERAKTAEDKKTDIVKRSEEKHQTMQKLMKEVKKSQEEVCQRLRTIGGTGERVKVLKTLAGVTEKAEQKPPTFLTRMEARNDERRKRWTEFQERKRRLEEEKVNAQRRREEEERLKEEEEKRQKLKELNEKRRIEREKKEEQKRLEEKLQKADSHYKKLLLRSHGLRPWVELVLERKDQHERASTFYERRLMEASFSRWKAISKSRRDKKMAVADVFHARILQKNYFLAWKDFREMRMRQGQVADDWNDFRTTERAFGKWIQFTQNEQLEYLNKKEMAVLNDDLRIKRKYLKEWREYPEFKRLERAKENRKRRWRQKIKDILPDYEPIDISDDFWKQPALHSTSAIHYEKSSARSGALIQDKEENVADAYKTVFSQLNY